MASNFISSTDFEINRIDGELNKYEVRTGSSTYTISGDESIADFFVNVLPKLTGQSLDEALTEKEKHQLMSMADKLKQLGVLFSVDERVMSCFSGEGDRQLFTFLARNAAHPERAFVTLKETDIWLVGDETLGRLVEPNLIRNGFHAAYAASLDELAQRNVNRNAIVIALLPETKAFLLYRLNNRFHADKLSWVPILFKPKQIAIGPWIQPGQTACYCCGTIRAESGNSDALTESKGLQALGWASCQPYNVQWLTGIVVNQLLQTLHLVGEKSPWGRKLVLDLHHMKQIESIEWKDPECSVCGSHTRNPQRWLVGSQ